MIELDEGAWVERQESAWVERQENRIAPSEHSKISKAIGDLESLDRSLSESISIILDQADEKETESIENFLVDHAESLIKVRCTVLEIIQSLQAPKLDWAGYARQLMPDNENQSEPDFEETLKMWRSQSEKVKPEVQIK